MVLLIEKREKEVNNPLIDGEKTYFWSSIGPTFCKVLATLNLTFATPSVERVRTVGNISLVVTSVPQASAKTLKDDS